MDHSFHISSLIAKKIKGTISDLEWKEIESWLNESDEHYVLYKKIMDDHNQLDKLEVYQLFKKENVWNELESKLFETKVIKFNFQKFYRYAASILLPVLISVAAVFYYMNKQELPSLAEIDSVVTPGSQKAMLVLADGETITLDQSKSIDKIDQGNSVIRNENNTLVYTSEEVIEEIKPLVYNELRTPIGGGYNLKLSDGTDVWLNAGSSIRFPIDFTDSIRKVFLVGEAYFDVSHNGKPFVVSLEDLDIRVLGTSFNVSAYSDEREIITTLVEGIVRITPTGTSETLFEDRLLAPDDQAVLDRNNLSLEINKVNTSQYTSWIQGKIEFSNDNLDVVMKRLARWYDFKYAFENPSAKDYHFTARINNTENISSILEMLEMTTDVKFEIRENTIVVI